MSERGRLSLPKWLWLAGALALSGCASNIANVKLEERPAGPNSRFRTLTVERSACEVPSQTRLYLDDARQLWLGCAYRYQGNQGVVLAHMGPTPTPSPVSYSNAEAVARADKMTRVPLKNCGSKLCGNLDAYGLMELSLETMDAQARLRYTDLSAGLKDIEAFYAQLDGRSATVNLDPQLVKLVKPASVAQRVTALDDVQDYRKVAAQLQTLGLQESAPVRNALRERHAALESAEFRRQGGFTGFQSAFALSGAAADLDAMQQLATRPEEKSAVFAALVPRYQATPSSQALQQLESFAVEPQSQAQLAAIKQGIERDRQAALQRAEESRLAEARREEAQRQAELRRQEDARLAEQRARQAKAEEERCLRDAKCRQAWEDRRAQCVSKVQSCRSACDRTTGSGSYGSFVANLSAAALARACYTACTCENNFGSLLTRFNLAVDGQAAPSTAPPPPATAASGKAKVFECKIYCKSASGPTISRRIEAPTRRDAARLAGERAGEFCAADGKAYASAVEFKESQCQER